MVCLSEPRVSLSFAAVHSLDLARFAPGTVREWLLRLERGARCVSSARRDLAGGRGASLVPTGTTLDSDEEGKIPLLGKEALRMYPTYNNPFLGKSHALN
jgi:hypothetical protein